MKKAVVLSIFIFALAAALLGLQPGRRVSPDGAPGWRPLGPEGGDISALAASGRNPSDVLALVNIGWYGPSYIYRSLDAGASWTKIARLDKLLFDLKRAPSDPSLVYGIARDRFYRSTDNGKTWTTVVFERKFYTYGRLAVDPRSPQRIYLAGSYNYKSYNTCMAVAKSGDGGATWAVRQIFPDYSAGMAYGIALDPLKPTTVYLGGYVQVSGKIKNYFLKSADGGATWTDLTGSITDTPIAIAVDPLHPKTIYAGAELGLFKTADGGQSWTKYPSKYYAYTLTIDPANPKTVYAGGEARIFKTIDGGRTWQTLSDGLSGGVMSIILPPAAPLAGTSSGIYTSADGGQTWRASQTGIERAQTSALAIAPSAPQTIYAALAGAGLSRSRDGGASWIRCGDLGEGIYNSVVNLAVRPDAPDVLYAVYEGETADNGLYRSLNGGDTWAKVTDIGIRRVAVQKRYPGNVIANASVKVGGKWVMALCVSQDGGDHWTTHPVPDDWASSPYSLACHPTNPDIIYLGGVRGDNGRGIIFRTTDGGETWTLINFSGHSGDFPYAMAVDPNTPSRIIVGAWRGIYRSENGGQTWSLRGIGKVATSVVFDPQLPGSVYLGWSNGVLRSLDGGRNWQAFNQGLEALSISGLVVDPGGRILYAATFGGGVCARKL
jgi:photosystem II stability/assembly factor-like uncharacterized protein